MNPLDNSVTGVFVLDNSGAFKEILAHFSAKIVANQVHNMVDTSISKEHWRRTDMHRTFPLSRQGILEEQSQALTDSSIYAGVVEAY